MPQACAEARRHVPHARWRSAADRSGAVSAAFRPVAEAETVCGSLLPGGATLVYGCAASRRETALGKAFAVRQVMSAGLDVKLSGFLPTSN